MKTKSLENDTIEHKDVIVVGNGPSGIALSYMLSGNLPYVVSDDHPDELLAARLRPAVGHCLLEQDMGQLAAGLEGRSTNPVSLLLDSLLHPYADAGLELEPLAEFKKAGAEINHLVLGKGPPGGSWHRMDPHILTLSLGSWMALPGLPFHSRDSGEKRAYAHNVAKYYKNYVHQMNLTNYFKNNTVVTNVEPLHQNIKSDTICHCSCHLNRPCIKNVNNNNHWMMKNDETDMTLIETEEPTANKYGLISNALSCLLRTTNRKARCCKRPSNTLYEWSPRKLKSDTNPFAIPKVTKRDKKRSTSFCCDSYLFSGEENTYKPGAEVHQPSSLPTSHNVNFFRSVSVPYSNKKLADCCQCCDLDRLWLVETTDIETGESTTYTCKNLVLACGACDIPNRLELFQDQTDPDWLVHDVRSLEVKLDEHLENQCHKKKNVDPVLVIGAGLTAADAIIATRARNVPVVHVYRSKSAEMNKQLPENMYPEYHKVYQMMKDGGTSYPLYTSYPEHSFVGFNESSRTVTLRSRDGNNVKINVSFAAVLIGARPDLSFLPKTCKIGVQKEAPIDCKTNTVNINKLTHQVEGYEGLFAIGPLAGDNFVRFIPGGALAVVSELYRRNAIV